MALAARKTAAKPTSKQQKIDFVKAALDVKTPGLFILGFIAGKQVILQFDKNKTVSTVVGKDNKALLIPALASLAGLTLAQLTKDRNFKMLAYGVSASGLHAVVKKMTGKDLLAGDLFDESDQQAIEGLGEVDAYGMPKADDNLMKALIASSEASAEREKAAAIEIEDEEEKPVVIPPVKAAPPISGADDFLDEEEDDFTPAIEGVEEVDLLDIG